MNAFKIGGMPVGLGAPCLIIAEAGVNHDGSDVVAHELVDAAFRAGANVVKFQTFRASSLVSTAAAKARYQQETTGADESQLEMLSRLELPRSLHVELAAHCREVGIIFMSTPFDQDDAEFLLELGVPAIKVPSGEITNIPYLEYLSDQRVPVIMSTGMATLEEVDRAVKTIRGGALEHLALLHCVSEYPAEPADVNLRAMKTLGDTFDVPTGYSDHTLGIDVPLAAAALGACIIEKHFTLDPNRYGPDHRASLDPSALASMVKGIRAVEAALGDGEKAPTRRELETAAVVRRSLTAACVIAAGTTLTASHVVARRPGNGLPPEMLPQVIGRRVTRDIAAGAQITMDVLA